ncbi:MAG TPA: hypothetical protein PKH60_04995, partial [Candidatus Woesebacteria bacterium]|nr:hypothetical protein [Candidatus Woesebacteria bacterium]
MTENVPAPEEVLAEAQTVMNDNPLGLEYGDIDGQSEAKNPLSSGELPSANLRLWRTMQRAIRELIDSFDTSKLNDVDTILLQTRILQSDSLLMTWFISSGNLQEMFELKMKSLLERGVCEDEDDMRLQICVDFINKIRQRNKEDQQYQNKYLPTIGIELEFLFIHDPDYPELNFNASDYYYRTNRLKPLDPPYKPIQEVNGAIEYAIGPSASHLTQLREILHL